MNLFKYALLRLFALILQIIGAIAVILSITSVISYDPSIFFAIGDTSGSSGGLGTTGRTPAEIAQFKKDIGLDKSLVQRFLDYISQLFLHGNLGNSWFGDKEPVLGLYLKAFLTTMRVFGLGILIFTILAIILGVLAARRLNGTLDKNIRLSTSFFYSFPPYVLGSLLIFVIQAFFLTNFQTVVNETLSNQFGLDPTNQPVKQILTSAITEFNHATVYVFLPVVIVILIYTGFQFRLVRIYISDVLNQNYIRTAHAKGLGERTILLKHGMRNALPEIITSIATTFPVAFSGVVVLEKVFNISGSGLLLINSGLTFNWPVLIGGAVIFTTLNAIILTVTDLLVNYIDPQLRLR